MEMESYGRLSKETSDSVFDASMKSKTGLNNFSAGATAAGQVIGGLAKAGAAATSAMYNNQKGAAAFNSSLDAMSEAAMAAGAMLTFMIPGGPVVKALIAGLTMATTAVIGLAKAANEQSDALYKGFQDLSKSGGAASDGMTGLFGDIQKLGLGFQDLGEYTQLIAQSSKELALFGGSVSDGRKQFANIGQAMEPFRGAMLNMGMDQKELNEATMAYLRLQSKVGQTQNKTANELADSARKYLVEQDALTKLTGMTRKEQEDAREEIRSQERFAAVLMEMRAKGQGKEAKELEDAYLILKSQSKEAAQGFADVSTGMLTTEAAQKSYLATQGESMRTAERIKASELTAAQGAQRVAAAHGANADAMGASLGKMGVYNQTFGDLAADLRLKGMSEGDIEKQLAKIKQDQIEQGVTGKKAADGLQQSQTDMRLAQQQAMLATQRMVQLGVAPATSAMTAFAEVVKSATEGLEKLLHILGFGPEETPEQKAAKQTAKKQDDQNWESASFGEKVQSSVARGLERAARGAGRVTGVKSLENLADTAQADRVKSESAYLKKEGKFNPVAPVASQSAGKGTGTEAVAPVASQSAGKGTGTEAVAARPKSGGPPNVDVKPTKPEDVIQFGDRSGSQTAFDQLEPSFRSAVLGAAEEFNMVTGKKIKLNSAFRDPEQQAKLYADWVAGGKKGMPVGKPGQSRHNRGEAVDIQNYNDAAAIKAFNNAGLYQKVPNDPVHFQFKDGGVVKGPMSGYQATLHGSEAIIPLKNGAVPVSLNLKEMMSAIKNPDLGFDLGSQLADIKQQGAIGLNESMDSMMNNFRNTMTQSIGQVLSTTSTTGGMEKIASIMEEMVRAQQASNSIQEKLLRAANS
jgi:hypothetical protein